MIRINHPRNGPKDLADTLAGAVYRLSQIAAWQLVDQVPGAALPVAANQPKLGGVVTEIPSPGTGVDYIALVREAWGDAYPKLALCLGNFV